MHTTLIKGVADFHVFSIGISTVQGAEWEELEWLVSSPSEMDKIRTFDMEDGRQLWQSKITSVSFVIDVALEDVWWGLAGPSS